MKIKDGFILKEVAGENVVIPTGSNLVDFNAMMTLNETGVFLWQRLEQDTTIDKLVDAVCAEYDIDRDIAIQDIKEFVQSLEANGII